MSGTEIFVILLRVSVTDDFNNGLLASLVGIIKYGDVACLYKYDSLSS